MSMFQKSVLKNTSQDESLVATRWVEYQKYLTKIDYIKKVKEEKFQTEFLQLIFENCLGYTLDSSDPSNFNLEREKKNETDGKLEERNFKNEWIELFENDSKIVLDLQSQINTVDNEIDKMVYELYGLSDEEIKIVEEI